MVEILITERNYVFIIVKCFVSLCGIHGGYLKGSTIVQLTLWYELSTENTYRNNTQIVLLV